MIADLLPVQGKGYRKGSESATSDRPKLGAAALAYARKGIPVFPLRPGTKEPLIKDWPNRATTDLRRIRAWWQRWPLANIGIPTGTRSGLLALDVDLEDGGFSTLEALEAEHGELTETATVGTGSGGMHYLFEYPAGETIRNSAGKLGAGLDVRGEGGYVVAPPSRTTGPYETLERRPLTAPPEWMLEALTRAHSAAGDAWEGKAGTVDRSATASQTAPTGGTIAEGERNWTLYRVACSLRARGLDAGGILEELHRANVSRCATPLDAGELEKIAASASRHAPGNATPEVPPEVLEALDAIEADIMRREWPGMGGKSERDAMIALVRLARMHGTKIPAGVRISTDIRTWALETSVSKRAMLDNSKKGERVPGIISRLKAKGKLRSDNADRRRGEAGAFVLLTPRAELHHSTTWSLSIEPGVACGATLRAPHDAPLTAPRLRWSRPVFDGLERVGTVSRLGKTKGAIIDHLEAAGGTLALEDLADALAGDDGKRPRPRDLRRRHLESLEHAGVVECSRDAVSLTADWLPALNERRDLDGEIADHRRDMAKYEREREAYRNRHKSPADPAPTVEEMRERREDYPERRRRGIEAAIAMLFTDRPEYRTRRVGQIVCGLHDYLSPDFPRGTIGYPKDHEVEKILDGEDVAA